MLAKRELICVSVNYVPLTAICDMPKLKKKRAMKCTEDFPFNLMRGLCLLVGVYFMSSSSAVGQIMPTTSVDF